MLVVPYAIGVDIGCGVALVETDLTVETLAADELDRVLEAIDAGVPTGFQKLPAAVDREVAATAMGMERPDSVKETWLTNALWQLGSLGGGNHFLEVQRDEAGRVFVMLHSGSRSLGKTICDEYHKRALAQNLAWHVQLPHRELAYLPVGTDDYAGYWSAMEFALRFAEVNRSRMLDVAEAAFGAFTKIGASSGGGRAPQLRRVGAPRRGEGDRAPQGRRPRSRGRDGPHPGGPPHPSYVGEGLGNAESFQTCQHSAGRAMSRTAARKAKTSDAVYAEMAELGVVLRSSEPKGVAEEAAFAYKDIESVMAASTSLVRPTKRLTPLGVVKG